MSDPITFDWLIHSGAIGSAAATLWKLLHVKKQHAEKEVIIEIVCIQKQIGNCDHEANPIQIKPAQKFAEKPAVSELDMHLSSSIQRIVQRVDRAFGLFIINVFETDYSLGKARVWLFCSLIFCGLPALLQTSFFDVLLAKIL